ncbi:MAG: heme exporter protein CcmD [Rhizobiales bacterium]|nr:heme exporter protein CcmD [Hyphomicrobiales bacterium]
MPELSYHGGFILAAYAVTAVVLAGMLLWMLLDGRAQKRRLAELEARGVRRRSAPVPPAAPAGAAP